MTRYRLLAADYDGTLASDGRVAGPTVDALQRLRQAGINLVLVTGRRLSDLQRIFPQLALFHRVIAENGALLYRPEDVTERLLAAPPPQRFVQRLSEIGAEPVAGRVIIGSRRPFEAEIARVIEEVRLDLRIIFNKDAVMILPAGVDKGTGLQAALEELGVALAETVGIGDAENDADFMARCGLSVAVANALPGLKHSATVVTAGEDGAGVVEAIENLFPSAL